MTILWSVDIATTISFFNLHTTKSNWSPSKAVSLTTDLPMKQFPLVHLEWPGSHFRLTFPLLHQPAAAVLSRWQMTRAPLHNKTTHLLLTMQTSVHRTQDHGFNNRKLAYFGITSNWRAGPVVPAKNSWLQMVGFREEWRCPSCHSAASTFLCCQDPSPLSVWPYSPNEWVDGC